MIATYNKGFPKWAKPHVEHAIVDAEKFIRAKYPSINFDDARVNFSMTRNRSVYKHNGRIHIRVGHKLHLYRKVSAEYTTPPRGLNVGTRIQTACAIIHELTHYVQGLEQRNYSEVETTKNEIEYLKVADPYWFSQLIKTQKD